MWVCRRSAASKIEVNADATDNRRSPMLTVEHGGPDGGQPVDHDFSTNANPLGPPAEVARAVAGADRCRYPDPAYAKLRAALASCHGVETRRVLPTAGTSEAIRRLTLAAKLRGISEAWVPRPGYSDYAGAACALSLPFREYDSGDMLLKGLGERSAAPALVWICEPSNPTGISLPDPFWREMIRVTASRSLMLGLDKAYEPLRLVGRDPVPIELANSAWQCFSPNKALGLTGVRAGYLLAPAEDALEVQTSVWSLAPSWVLSAEGVALLGAWQQPDVSAWLTRCRMTLAQWARTQREAFDTLGWSQRPSVVPFSLVRPLEQGATLSRHLAEMRREGIKVRDATSMGLPGWLRVSAQAPNGQQALVRAWKRATESIGRPVRP
jgi:histidinol-phosphate aminotransferase